MHQAVTEAGETPDQSERAELFAKWQKAPAWAIGWQEGLLLAAGYALTFFALGFMIARSL